MTDVPTVTLTEAVGPAIPITTGADPVSVEPTTQVYEITTGGTAGAEIINLPDPDTPNDGANGAIIGRKIVFYIGTQTDPADVVNINGPTRVNTINSGPQNISGSVVLDYVGAAAVFVWANYHWHLDQVATEQSDNSELDSAQSYNIALPDKTSPGAAGSVVISAASSFPDDINGCDAEFHAGDASGAGSDGGSVLIQAGSQTGLPQAGDGGHVRVIAGQSSEGTAGDVVIQSGSAINGGDGGNIVFQLGTSSGIDGNILLHNLPFVDPGVTEALWNDGGMPMMSGSTLATVFAGYLGSLPTDDPAVAGEPWLDNGVFTVSAG